MQALKTLVVVMGVLIVVGTAALIFAIYHKAAGGVGGSVDGFGEVALGEDSEVRVVHSTVEGDRLVLHLRDIGPRDRLVIFDLVSGEVIGRITVQGPRTVQATP